MKIRKEITYSYPTSPNATRLGFAKSGCFHVSVCRLFIDNDGLWDSETLDPVKGYASKNDPALLAEYDATHGEHWEVAK